MRIGTIARLGTLAVLVLAGLVLTALFVLRGSVKKLRARADTVLGRECTAVRDRLQFEMGVLRGDVEVLANSSAVNGLCELYARRDEKTTGAPAYQDELQDIQSEFFQLLTSRKDYLQIRYILSTEGGQELVRVERPTLEDGTMGPPRIVHSELPQKGDREYFREIVDFDSLEPYGEEYYLSRIELNVDNNKRGPPVIRAAGRVYNAYGALFGIVIINVLFEPMRARIREEAKRAGHELYIVDDRGYFLAHPDASREFGFERAEGEHAHLTLLNDRPWEDPQRKAIGHYFKDPTRRLAGPLVLRIPESDKQVYMQAVPMHDSRESTAARFMGVGLAGAEAKPLADLGRRLLVTAFGLGLLSALIAGLLYWLSRKLIRPVEQMTEATATFSEDGTRQALPVGAGAEIGKLAQSLDQMMSRIQTSQQALVARGRTIRNAVFDGVITILPDGRVESINLAAERMFGLSSGEASGRYVGDFIFEGALPELENELPQFVEEAAKSGKAVELRGKTARGKVFPVMLGIRQVVLPEGRIYAGVVRDISRQKATEEELLRSAAQAREAHERAVTANRAMKDYVAEMGHDLRAPLVPMKMAASLLIKKAKTYTPEQVIDKCEMIRGAVDHQGRLLTAILDLSRIEAGKLDRNFVPLDTLKVVHEAVRAAAMSEDLTTAQGNTLSVALPDTAAPVFAVKDHLVRVLVNLLTNAEKFTENGEIRVRVVDRSASDGEIEFRVEDSGKGMTGDQLAGLFQAYGQTKEDRENRKKFGGAGLGLAITQRLCIAMNGSIHAESEVGEGSAFVVRLPTATEQATAPSTDVAVPVIASTDANPSESAGSYTVLVVDDDPRLRALIRESLEQEGIHVETAETGEEGLRLAEKIRPHVITLDIVMRGMDGWEFLRQIKQRPDLAGIPTILLSIIEDRRRGYELGAIDYITKPFDTEALIAAVRKHCAEAAVHDILIVDDDASIRASFREAVETAGYRVREAVNGKDALARLHESPAALIILDIEMPEMNGYEFLDAFGENPSWREIPVLVVTGLDLVEADIERLQRRVTRVLKKELAEAADLMDAVRVALGGYYRRHEEAGA